MTTRSHLAKYGVTVTQAHDFIKANLGSPATIYSVAKQYGVDSQMLAEIMSLDYPGLNAAGVEGFFQGQGLSGSGLHSATGDISSQEPLLSSGFSAISGLVHFNQSTGELSNQALRAKVTANTNPDDYKFAFAAFNYQGAADGTFTAKELGVNNLASFSATWENMESLYYGTAISALQSIDKAELQTVKAFYKANSTAINNDDEVKLGELRTLVIDMLNTPATDPAYPSATLAQDLATHTATVVKLIGNGSEYSVLSALLSSVIGI